MTTPIIELVVTVCLIVAPESCDDEHFPVYVNMPLATCAMQAMPTIARWADEHEDFLVKAWHCRYYADRERSV